MKWDHELVIGDTYAPGEIQLLDAGGLPIDITGSTAVVRVRKEAGGELLLSPTYAITSGTDGRFTWTDTAAHTAVLHPSVNVYAVRITFADGTVRTVLTGRVSCVASVIP